jgi:hypothetical protein
MTCSAMRLGGHGYAFSDVNALLVKAIRVDIGGEGPPEPAGRTEGVDGTPARGATGRDLRCRAAGSYSLTPRTGRRRILPWIGSGQASVGVVVAAGALDAE